MLCVGLFILDISLHYWEILSRQFWTWQLCTLLSLLSLLRAATLCSLHGCGRVRQEVRGGVRGRLGWRHPLLPPQIPALRHHLLGVWSGGEAFPRLARHCLEHHIWLETLWRGSTREVAAPQHGVKVSRGRPEIRNVVVLIVNHFLIHTIHSLVQQSQCIFETCVDVITKLWVDVVVQCRTFGLDIPAMENGN